MVRSIVRPRGPLAAAAAIAAVVLGGCAPFAYVAAQFAPPERVAPVYEPPKGKTWLVFVDDFRQTVNYEPVRRALTEQLNERLIEEDVAAEVVSYDRLMELVARAPDFGKMRVGEVGRQLGAEVVLYVDLKSFRLKEHDQTSLWTGMIQTEVRLVSPESERLWPQDCGPDQGYEMTPVALPPVDEASETYAGELTRELAGKQATEIARLFHQYEIRPGQPPEGSSVTNMGWDE